MKKILSLAALIASQFAFANPFVDGHSASYEGAGNWKAEANATQGAYTVKTNLTYLENGQYKVTSSYAFAEGGTMESNMHVRFKENQFFDVFDQNNEKKIGKGYCFSQANNHDVCHYHFHVEQMIIEETLAFMNNKLYRVGSKENHANGSHETIAWTENLEAAAK